MGGTTEDDETTAGDAGDDTTEAPGSEAPADDAETATAVTETDGEPVGGAGSTSAAAEPVDDSAPTFDDMPPVSDGGAAPTRDDMAPMALVATAEPEKAPRRQGRLRAVLVGILVLLTSLSVIVAATTTWAHRTVFNTDAWLKVVGPLPQEPGVSDAAAQFVVTQIQEVADIQGTVQAALPSQLAPLVGVVADRVRAAVEARLATFIASDTFHTAWVAVNRAAHDAAIRVLNGDTKLVQTNNEGEVSLNLVPLVYAGLEFLQERVPFVMNGHQVPTGIDPVTDPDGAVQALSDEFGRTLPANFAQPVVFQSEKLAAAQDAVHLFNVLFVFALVLPFVLAAVAILVSRRRRRTIVQLAVGVVLAVVLGEAVVRRLQESIVDAVKSDSGREAIRDTLAAALHSLRVILLAFLIVGLVAAIAAYFSGRPKWVGSLSATFRRWGNSDRARGVETYVAGRQTGFVWGGVAVAIVALWITGLSWTPFLVIGSFLGLWVLAVLAIGRRVALEGEPVGVATATDLA